eukprot:3674976-Rhodomonas_salina.1
MHRAIPQRFRRTRLSAGSRMRCESTGHRTTKSRGQYLEDDDEEGSGDHQSSVVATKHQEAGTQTLGQPPAWHGNRAARQTPVRRADAAFEVSLQQGVARVNEERDTELHHMR